METYKFLAGREIEIKDDFVGLDDSNERVIYEIRFDDDGTPICDHCRRDDGSIFDPGDNVDVNLLVKFWLASSPEEVFKFPRDNGQRFDKYEPGVGNMQYYDKIYHYAIDILNLPSEIDLDIGDDGVNIVRITAVMPDGKGYDFSFSEIEEALNYN